MEPAIRAENWNRFMTELTDGPELRRQAGSSAERKSSHVLRLMAAGLNSDGIFTTGEISSPLFYHHLGAGIPPLQLREAAAGTARTQNCPSESTFLVVPLPLPGARRGLSAAAAPSIQGAAPRGSAWESSTAKKPAWGQEGSSLPMKPVSEQPRSGCLRTMCSLLGGVMCRAGVKQALAERRGSPRAARAISHPWYF